MMAHDSEQEKKLRQYFLGELTFEEQVLVEQRLFLDSDYAEVARAVEDDLIDDYVHNDLTHKEQLRFEGRFLKRPEREDDVRIAAALKIYIAPDSFVPLHVEQFLERPRDARNPPGASGRQVVEFMGPEHVVATVPPKANDRLEDSPPKSVESSKQNAKWWLLLVAAILIVLCIVLWFWSRLN